MAFSYFSITKILIFLIFLKFSKGLFIRFEILNEYVTLNLILWLYIYISPFKFLNPIIMFEVNEHGEVDQYHRIFNLLLDKHVTSSCNG